MTIDASMTLAQMIDRSPQLAREFERLGLDYCCGGARTLDEAGRALGFDIADLVLTLEHAAVGTEPGDWTTMGVSDLVDHVVEVHHGYLWDELPRVGALVEKILDVHGERHPELAEIAACWSAVRADLEPHLLKEERELFPMVKELAAAGSTREPISVTMREHDELGALLATLRSLTDGYRPPDDGCATYRACFVALEELEADTHLHIHKENNVLFPMVDRLEVELAARSQ